LELEITESHIMEDVTATVAKLEQLKALGVRLAVDDFGTGYSSLGHLMRFPIDNLKIDKSFIQNLPNGQTVKGKNDTVIVEAVVALSRALDLGVVSEGVESSQQVAHLRDLGCDAGQGYYFAKPMPAEAVVPFMLQQLAGPQSV
jgi:diguanylate cyclase